MDAQQPTSVKAFEAGTCPTLVGTHFIDEVHSNRHARLLHMHKQELELFYVYHGEGQYIVNSCPYHVEQGDMVICNANILHGEDPSQQRRMRSYSIALTNVYMEGLPDNHLIQENSYPIVCCGMLSEQIGAMMRLIYLLYSKQNHLEQVCEHTTLAIFWLIYDLLLSRERHMKEPSTLTTNQLARRIQDYLDEHYCEPLTLQHIANALHISEYHLAHVFKAEVGMPPMQYIMKRRMGEAQTLLMDTDLPIADISDRLGYANPWNFSTSFHKCVGMSPSQYRQSFHTMTE